MFGRDQLVLSKPREIKPVAKSFAKNIQNLKDEDGVMKAVAAAAENRNKSIKHEIIPRPATKPITSVNRGPVQSKYEVVDSDLSEIELTMRKGYLKLEVVRPYAKNFLKQVNKLEDVKEDSEEKDALGKIVFSYSDSKGRWGELSKNGEKIKIIHRKKNNKDFPEDQIDIYSLNSYNVSPSGVYVQVKGWGNHKELSVLNALKNSLSKLPQSPNNKSDSSERIIFSYTLSSMSSLADGGWECKVKVIPGKIS